MADNKTYTLSYSAEEIDAKLGDIENKEDVSNKIIEEGEMPGTAKYFSAEATKKYFKSTYDSDGDGIVDNAKLFDGISKEELFAIIILGTHSTHEYDTYDSFIQHASNSAGLREDNGKIGDIILIHEEGFPNLIITKEFDVVNINPELTPTSKETALHILSTHGYIETEGGLGFEHLSEEGLKRFEQTSNKVSGGNMPVTHPDCTIAKDDYYVSLKYLKECFDYFKEEINASGGGGNVDLSDYYTKEQIDEKIGDIEALLGGI